MCQIILLDPGITRPIQYTVLSIGAAIKAPIIGAFFVVPFFVYV